MSSCLFHVKLSHGVGPATECVVMNPVSLYLPAGAAVSRLGTAHERAAATISRSGEFHMGSPLSDHKDGSSAAVWFIALWISLCITGAECCG